MTTTHLHEWDVPIIDVAMLALSKQFPTSTFSAPGTNVNPVMISHSRVDPVTVVKASHFTDVHLICEFDELEPNMVNLCPFSLMLHLKVGASANASTWPMPTVITNTCAAKSKRIASPLQRAIDKKSGAAF